MKATYQASRQPNAPPPLVPIQPTSRESSTSRQSASTMPRSPFFRPSNARLSTVQTPMGTRRSTVVINNVPLKDEEKKSSLLGAYANLCNITIGAGIVGLPYAIKEAGMIAGVIMIIVCAIMTDYSLRQVITTGKRANVNSYETLMEAAFGRAGFLILSLSMFFLSYGAMLAYLTIIKDVLPILFGVAPDDEFTKRVILTLSSLLVILPLSMQRDMADLEKTSRFNVVLNLILVGIVAGFSPVAETIEAKGGLLQVVKQEMIFDVNAFFVGFGVASFAFVCQDSSFIIAGSLENPTKSRWKTITQTAMSTCCALELIIGLCGYLAYQEYTSGNVLNNMEINNWPGLVSRAILATTMFFAYPMNLYIARHVCVVLCFEGISAHEGDDHRVLSRNDRRVIVTWILYLASLIPSLMNIPTGLILSATGAIGGSSIAYIGPGVSFIAVYHTEFIEAVRSHWQSSSKYLWKYPSIESERNEQTISVGIISWYILLMPFWSSIAQLGEQKMSEYIEKQNMISPGLLKPKRLTVVDPDMTSGILPQCHSAGNGEETFLVNPNSRTINPYGGTLSIDPEFINAASRLTRLSVIEIEEEIKMDEPTWVEFYIAMAYVIIGVVAMSLGLFSVATK